MRIMVKWAELTHTTTFVAPTTFMYVIPLSPFQETES